jgi:hypothetical protein
MEERLEECHADGCGAQIQLSWDNDLDASKPFALDDQRYVEARVQGWLTGVDPSSGLIRLFCPAHRTENANRLEFPG